MSTRNVTLSWLTIRPSIQFDGHRLVATTSRLVQWLTLFSYCRRVIVDRDRREITLKRVLFWGIFKQRRVPFESVSHIDYGFDAAETEWSTSALDPLAAQDQVETFSIGLVLKEPEEKLHLFSFHGEGAVNTGWRGVVMGGDTIFDFTGEQEGASLSCVELLREILQVPIGRPLTPIKDMEGNVYRCRDCGRSSAPRCSKCIYCGGLVEKVRSTR